MVKHTKIIRRQQSTSCFSVIDDFAGLPLKELKKLLKKFGYDKVLQ